MHIRQGVYIMNVLGLVNVAKSLPHLGDFKALPFNMHAGKFYGRFLKRCLSMSCIVCSLSFLFLILNKQEQFVIKNKEIMTIYNICPHAS